MQKKPKCVVSRRQFGQQYRITLEDRGVSWCTMKAAIEPTVNVGGRPKMQSAKGRNRTDDTSIFSAVLYRLSYLGARTTIACLLEIVKPLWAEFVRAGCGRPGTTLRSFGYLFEKVEVCKVRRLCEKAWYTQCYRKDSLL
jgi:hypothetical protein